MASDRTKETYLQPVDVALQVEPDSELDLDPLASAEPKQP